MSDNQAHAQGGDKAGQRDARLFRQLPGDGNQDDEGGVEEHGDSHDDARNAQGQGRVFDADGFQHQICDFLRAARLIEELAQDDAQGNHDADAGHGGAEAGGQF